MMKYLTDRMYEKVLEKSTCGLWSCPKCKKSSDNMRLPKRSSKGVRCPFCGFLQKAATAKPKGKRTKAECNLMKASKDRWNEPNIKLYYELKRIEGSYRRTELLIEMFEKQDMERDDYVDD